MPELRDGDTNAMDDEKPHEKEQNKIGDKQSHHRSEDTIAGKNECPNQNQLQAGFEKEERRVSFDLLKCPEVVELEEVHALQKDDYSEDPGDCCLAIEECSGYGLGQEKQSDRCKART